MNQLKFKSGDVVQLKSGGPIMTVFKYKPNPMNNAPMKDSLFCTWFDENGVKQSSSFHEDQLELASE